MNAALDLSSYFDQIYILHLDTLTDRKQSIIRQIHYHKLQNVTIIDALDKNKINVEKMKEDQIIAYPGNNYCKNEIINNKGDTCWCKGRGHNDIVLSTGKIACAFSHYFAYVDMVKNDYEKCIVLEDDFLLKPNLNNIWVSLYPNLPLDWEVILFSNSFFIDLKNNDIFTNYNKSFVKTSKGVQNTSCYAINNSAANILHRNFFPVRAAADGYIGVCLDRLFELQNVYISKKDLSQNGSTTTSRFNTTIDKHIKNQYTNTELNITLKQIVNKYHPNSSEQNQLTGQAY